MSPYPTVVMVTTAHQNASGIDRKNVRVFPDSAKYTRLEKSTIPENTFFFMRYCYRGLISNSHAFTEREREGLYTQSFTRTAHFFLLLFKVFLFFSSIIYFLPFSRLWNFGTVKSKK